jgi:uncharacterized RDD family membrane protein YckC
LLLAGPIARFLAWSIDIGCILVLQVFIGSILTVAKLLHADILIGFTIISYFVLTILYPILFEWFARGQTLGKRVLKLRVMDVQGLRLQFSQVVIRNLLRFVDNLPILYFVGGVTSLLSRYSQRLGDMAANTIVVRSPRIREPDISQLLSDKFNSLREHPHLAARLRQNVSPREAGLILQALIRREELEPLARVEIFKEMADHLKKLTTFPPDAVDGLTDEQYLRNVVDILFQKTTS